MKKDLNHHRQETHRCFFNVIGTRFEDHVDQLVFTLKTANGAAERVKKLIIISALAKRVSSLKMRQMVSSMI
jgi:hypothetical protein